MKVALKRVLERAWRYGAVSLLIVYAVFKIFTSLVLVEAPGLQTPPEGYVVHGSRTQLIWTPGDEKEAFELQVFAGSDKKELFFQKETRSNKVFISGLEGGRKYCWRVYNDDDARMSCFKTARHLVPY